jgi:hypothetical protein
LVEAIFHALNHNPEIIEPDELIKRIQELLKNLEIMVPLSIKNKNEWVEFFALHSAVSTGQRDKLGKLLQVAQEIRNKVTEEKKETE